MKRSGRQMKGSGRQASREPDHKHRAWETNEKKWETNKRKWETSRPGTRPDHPAPRRPFFKALRTPNSKLFREKWLIAFKSNDFEQHMGKSLHAQSLTESHRVFGIRHHSSRGLVFLFFCIVATQREHDIIFPYVPNHLSTRRTVQELNFRFSMILNPAATNLRSNLDLCTILYLLCPPLESRKSGFKRWNIMGLVSEMRSDFRSAAAHHIQMWSDAGASGASRARASGHGDR